MAVFKCKMCGGALEINASDSIAVCEYCNTKQTLPKLDDEKRAQLYDRANHFRRENEFDKAMGIYEMILSEDKKDCESYWGIVLCRYGIEYVEDPRSHKRIPTVNRAQFTSIFDDEDYKNAINYADALQKEVYEAEAEIIDKIQKGILAISQKEEPFDVFICYKETDALGNRTQDSVYAQDIYTALTKESYKVFFSRITLEDKLGSAYEPYIFAALNSARVMLVVGTTKDNFNAVWVKNEWSRYLNLIKQGKEKTLIPVYKDISPYDMPEEFQYLQSQDMSKIGYLQDLIHGINKLVEVYKTTVKETVVINQGNSQAEPLLKRAFMFLEDGDFARADDFCEQVLNIDPENARAYLGKLMVELRVKKQDNLKNLAEPFNDNANYQKTLRFADEKLKGEVVGYIDFIVNRNLTDAYNNAITLMNSAQSEEEFKDIATQFEALNDFQDSKNLAKECYSKAEVSRKDDIYAKANIVFSDNYNWKFENNDLAPYQESIKLFRLIPGWRDADEKVEKCQERIKEIEEKIEAENQANKKREKIKAIIWVSVIACMILILFMVAVWITTEEQRKAYNTAVEFMDEGKYREAIVLLGELEDYKDSENYYSNALKIIADRNSVSAGNSHTVCLKSDGTVVAVGYNEYGQCNVEDWSDIVSVSTGGHRTIGLKSDGTVVIAGDCGSYEHDLRNYRDFVSVSSSFYNIVGLKSDGTVVVMNDGAHGEGDVQSWKGITAIATGSFHTVGLKSDATVVAVGLNDDGQCDVQNWRNIVAVSAHVNRTVGLKSDGTVVAVGDNEHGECNVSGWTDIVAIETTEYCTIGLKSDGTVLFAGINSSGQREVQNWTDIVEISANITHVVGLKSDGTVVAVGSDKYGQCDVSDWKNIKLPDNQ